MEGFPVCSEHAESWPGGRMPRNDFDPLLCFARTKDQTADEVFDMLQERMKTMLGVHVQEDCKKYPVSFEKVNPSIVMHLTDWRRTGMVIGVDDFDAIGKKYGLSMADVLGSPVIHQADRKEISKAFEGTDSPGLDPVAAFVTLATFDRLEWITAQRKEIACG